MMAKGPDDIAIRFGYHEPVLSEDERLDIEAIKHGAEIHRRAMEDQLAQLMVHWGFIAGPCDDPFITLGDDHEGGGWTPEMEAFARESIERCISTKDDWLRFDNAILIIHVCTGAGMVPAERLLQAAILDGTVKTRHRDDPLFAVRTRDLVKTADIRSWMASLSKWTEPAQAVPEVLPTGDPGRPGKGYQLYEAEFERRCAEGKVEVSLAAQARELRQWFVCKYPKADPPSLGVIENRIRDQYRQKKPTKHPTI